MIIVTVDCAIVELIKTANIVYILKKRPRSFSLAFWISHERNCNFLVITVAFELDIITLKISMFSMDRF